MFQIQILRRYQRREAAVDEALRKVFLLGFRPGKPALRWQFLSGDRVELDLSVGAREKNGARRYARMAGKSLVFLLDPINLKLGRPDATHASPDDAGHIRAPGVAGRARNCTASPGRRVPGVVSGR